MKPDCVAVASNVTAANIGPNTLCTHGKMSTFTRLLHEYLFERNRVDL